MSYCASFALLCLCLVACAAVRPPATATDEIGFVRLEVTTAGARIVSVDTEPGRLKRPRRAPEGAFQVDVVDVDGHAMWTTAMEDPLRERQEYVDDAGALQTRWVDHARAEVVVRMPVTASQQTLQVYRLTEAGGKRSARTRLATLTVTW
ncbi:MAG: hypothetical protein AAF730_03880 [Bacteroidota bacterium]